MHDTPSRLELLGVPETGYARSHAISGETPTERLTIYVSGPLRAPTLAGRLANVQRAIDTGTALARRGHWPYVPHLSHYWDPDDTLFGWEWWLAFDHHWVSACAALFYIAPSQGADLELGWAQAEGKRIFTRVDDVPLVEARDA